MQHASQGVEEEQMVVDGDEAICLQAPSSSARVEDENWENEARLSAQHDDLPMPVDERGQLRTARHVKRREVPAVRLNVSYDEEESDEDGVVHTCSAPKHSILLPSVANSHCYDVGTS
ncbi:hypothetical protein Y032_0497g2496 [Ancylostoma ceylanicum]|uniref:Uncharacterized protein n=1 Tax=Ancylostoma ceylanicum TaxID=53326 RepID=A0A016WVL7_9BILA|nr:hypothetical protein Y032_0497g2496 [Ancylostoma ceylanicum]